MDEQQCRERTLCRFEEGDEINKMKTNIKLFAIGLLNVFAFLVVYSVYIYFFRIETSQDINIWIQLLIHIVLFAVNMYLTYCLLEGYKSGKNLFRLLFVIFAYIAGAFVMVYSSLLTYLTQWSVRLTVPTHAWAGFRTGMTGFILLCSFFVVVLLACLAVLILKLIKIKKQTSIEF